MNVYNGQIRKKKKKKKKDSQNQSAISKNFQQHKSKELQVLRGPSKILNSGPKKAGMFSTETCSVRPVYLFVPLEKKNLGNCAYTKTELEKHVL